MQVTSLKQNKYVTGANWALVQRAITHWSTLIFSLIVIRIRIKIIEFTWWKWELENNPGMVIKLELEITLNEAK